MGKREVRATGDPTVISVALEQQQQDQKLVLMSAAVEPAPALFEDGRSMRLPPNVWFVGTANHDETTKDFADKTYDRAHVMELPRNRNEFSGEDVDSTDPISLKAFQKAFDKARKHNAGAAEGAYAFLDKYLSPVLNSRFRIGWGNRLQRQIQNYLPVVIAAGGSVGEATDRIVASKLLRKIRDRHDNDPDDLRLLRSEIEERWSKLDPEDGPVKSIEIIRHELHRLGQDDD